MNTPLHFSKRRQLLAQQLPSNPVLLASGRHRHRNFSAFTFEFRASSHYLFFGAPNEPNQILLLVDGIATLYQEEKDADDAIWHGPAVTSEDIAEKYGLNAVKGFAELKTDILALGPERVLSLPSPDTATNLFLETILGRIPKAHEGPDAILAEAMVALRSCQDEEALVQLKSACEHTQNLQRAIIKACQDGVNEASLKGVYDQYISSSSLSRSFQPILSTRGEILHNPHYNNTLKNGELLLIDCGAEVASGYAGDLTRTIPVSGTFSPSQKAIYNIVDHSRAKAISLLRPGVSFQDVHRAASLEIARGLVELKILRGDPEALVTRGAHALFFCHGLGHLIGLDVHDMEDLGDAAGYPKGVARAKQFGLSNLRLARELKVGMVVTIEPGFYQVPAILDGPLGASFSDCLNREQLTKYSDVRGIRIEDMALITKEGCDVLSKALPTGSSEIERLCLQKS